MNNNPCGGDKVSNDKDPCLKGTCISDTCWIERPKFFNGQLLTDVDLKAGLDYVIEKNKLHNRHLHGWGVVCGLKVKCYPCCEGHGSSGKVVVEPGHAIDCCGNDIVVCEETDYDVVKKINEMIKKKKAQASPCENGTVIEETECPDQEEKYYLTLSYKEEDAKPATALKGNDPCSIQSCVPSRTRECFELDLVKYCTLEPTPEENIFTRMRRCLTLFTETWTRVVGTTLTWEALLDLSEDELKTLIREYYKALPSNVHCDILDRLEDDQGTVDTPDTLVYQGACSDWDLPEPTTLEPVPGHVVTIFADIGFKLTTGAQIVLISENHWEIQDGTTVYIIKRTCSPFGNSISCQCTVEKKGGTVEGKPYDLLVQLLVDCICQSILPPCPTCGKDDRVILATITVKDKKIHNICNFSRKYVLTSLSFNYWFAPFINAVVSALFSPLGKKYNFKIDSFGDLTEFLCCIIDISKKQSTPPYVYIMKLLENDFDIPKMMGANFTESMSTFSRGFVDSIDPRNISLKSALDKTPEESGALLQQMNVEVVGTETYEPTIEDASLTRVFTTRPYVKPGSRVIQLVDNSNNVVGFRVVDTVKMDASAFTVSTEPTISDVTRRRAGSPDDEVKVLKKMLSDMTKKVNKMEKELKEIKSKSAGSKASKDKKK